MSKDRSHTSEYRFPLFPTAQFSIFFLDLNWSRLRRRWVTSHRNSFSLRIYNCMLYDFILLPILEFLCFPRRSLLFHTRTISRSIFSVHHTSTSRFKNFHWTIQVSQKCHRIAPVFLCSQMHNNCLVELICLSLRREWITFHQHVTELSISPTISNRSSVLVSFPEFQSLEPLKITSNTSQNRLSLFPTTQFSVFVLDLNRPKLRKRRVTFHRNYFCVCIYNCTNLSFPFGVKCSSLLRERITSH